MGDILTIHRNTKLLLTKYPFLRNPYQRKQAHIYYWREFEMDKMGELLFNILLEEYPEWTSAETISREIRKVQEKNPELRPLPEQELKKYEMAEKHRLNYSGKTLYLLRD